jgi:hypothetical protein
MQMQHNSFKSIPMFTMAPSELRETVDHIADSAMTGLERIAEALSVAPAEVRPLLVDLRAILSSIGFSADSTATDTGVDLRLVWGIDMPLALVAANSPVLHDPEHT